MDELHLRLLRVDFTAGDDLGLVLAGGYALSAHKLLSRPSREIDFATATAVPLPVVAGRLANAYTAEGLGCRIIEAGNRMARLLVSTDITGLRGGSTQGGDRATSNSEQRAGARL